MALSKVVISWVEYDIYVSYDVFLHGILAFKLLEGKIFSRSVNNITNYLIDYLSSVKTAYEKETNHLLSLLQLRKNFHGVCTAHNYSE
jgi:hypothetical protein